MIYLLSQEESFEVFPLAVLLNALDQREEEIESEYYKVCSFKMDTVSGRV